MISFSTEVTQIALDSFRDLKDGLVKGQILHDGEFDPGSG